MAWGQFHEVPYNSGLEEKILGPFSFSKLMYIVPAILVSNQINEVYPKIGFIDNIVLCRIHLLIPILIAVVLAYFKDGRTNLTLSELMFVKLSIRFRKRSFYYHRKNMPKEEELR